MKVFMNMDLNLCTFCIPIWPLASAPQREYDTGFGLNALDISQDILKESAQWDDLILGPQTS